MGILEVYIRVEDAIEKPNRGTLVGILIRQVKVNHPFALLVRRVGRSCVFPYLPIKST